MRRGRLGPRSKAAAAPLVMLPGLMCDDRTFAFQSAAFPGSIAFSGYRGADAIVRMADAVLARMPSKVSLLGHSMGARVALEVVRKAPERVERLALVSTGVHAVRAGEPERRRELVELGRREGVAALLGAWLPPMVGASRRNDPVLMSRVREMCLDTGLERFETDVTALLSRPEVQSLLPGLHCPVLICVGEEDEWSPPAQHKAIAASVPHATLVVIPEAGHMLPMEDPEALNATIDTWLDL